MAAARQAVQSIKIRPNLVVFFVPDSVYLSQVIRAPERPGVDDSARHYGADSRYQSQLFFRRGVDVEFASMLRGCACHIRRLPPHAPCSGFPSLRFILQALKSLAFGSRT